MRNDELDTTNNSRVYKLIRRRKVADAKGACAHCPPHEGENAARKSDYRRARLIRKFGRAYFEGKIYRPLR